MLSLQMVLDVAKVLIEFGADVDAWDRWVTGGLCSTPTADESLVVEAYDWVQIRGHPGVACHLFALVTMVMSC
jgi:hypothetical protein